MWRVFSSQVCCSKPSYLRKIRTGQGQCGMRRGLSGPRWAGFGGRRLSRLASCSFVPFVKGEARLVVHQGIPQASPRVQPRRSVCRDAARRRVHSGIPHPAQTLRSPPFRKIVPLRFATAGQERPKKSRMESMRSRPSWPRWAGFGGPRFLVLPGRRPGVYGGSCAWPSLVPLRPRQGSTQALAEVCGVAVGY
jgi:hypothetical protein